MNPQPIESIGSEPTLTNEQLAALAEILHGFGIELEEHEIKELLEQNEPSREDELDEQVENHPAVRAAKALLEQAQFERDLAAIKGKYPDEPAESVWDIGEPFITIVLSGFTDALTAYDIHRARLRDMLELPPSAGSARSKAGVEREYYTPSEVDRLSASQLNDPAVFKKIRSSMLRWKNK